MNYYDEIKNILIDNEVYSRIKDCSKEINRVKSYYEIGKLLNSAGSKYGENIIEEYSKRLVIEVGKTYNKRTLFRMKQFYVMFKDEKVSPSATQLTWSHYVELLPIKDNNKRLYYYNVAILEKLSRNDLRKRIKSLEYERLPKDKLLINSASDNISNYLKNPILISNHTNDEIINEKVLQRLILEDISNFLKELGTGFSYIDNEYKIKIGNTYNYIDLLLFNIIFNCYVVIELKVTELKKGYIGQIQVYMNYIDKEVKSINHNKTIGIIICRKDNKYIMEYCSDERVLRTTYLLEK